MQIYNERISRNKFLVGDKNFNQGSLEPFNETVCDFLDFLSKYLMKSQYSNNHSDIKTFAFFCRKKMY